MVEQGPGKLSIIRNRKERLKKIPSDWFYGIANAEGVIMEVDFSPKFCDMGEGNILEYIDNKLFSKTVKNITGFSPEDLMEKLDEMRGCIGKKKAPFEFVSPK